MTSNFKMKLLHTKLIEYPEQRTLRLGMSEQDVLYLFKQHFPFIKNVQIVFESLYYFKARLFDKSIPAKGSEGDRTTFINFELKFSDHHEDVVELGRTDGTVFKKNISDRQMRKTAAQHWLLAMFDTFRARNFRGLSLYVAGQKEKTKQTKEDFSFYTKPPLGFRLTGNYINLEPEAIRRFGD